MAKLNQDSKKKHLLIKHGSELLIKHGFRRVSVDEICQKSGVSKMTFYRHFRNKHDLCLALLDELAAESLKKYEAIMAEPISFDKKISQVLDMKMQAQQRFSEELLRDIIADEVLHEHLHRWQNKLRDQQLEFLHDGQKAGWIREGLSDAFYLYLLDWVMEQLHDPKLSEIYPNVKDRIQELTKFWFYGIFPAGGEAARQEQRH